MKNLKKKINLKNILENKINIAFCVDSNFIQHLTVTLYSLCTHLNKKRLLDVYVVYNNLSLEEMYRLKKDISKFKNTKIFFVKDDFDYNSLKTDNNITQSVFLKINLPNTIPIKLKKVLYLDCDIVVNGDISELYNQKVKYLMAVKDSNPYLYTYYNSLFHIQNKNGYFNAGLMLMNLNELRRIKSSKHIMNYCLKYSHYFHWHDQTGFNYFLHDKYEQIHPKFNFLQCIFSFRDIKQNIYNQKEYEEAKKNPIVIHYPGNIYKPWLYESIGPHKNLYYKYISKTSYKNYKPKKTIKKVLIKFRNYFILMFLPAFMTVLLAFFYGKIFLYKSSAYFKKF